MWSASGNASAGRSTHSTAASIRYYHVISVGVICFLIGAITSFVVLLHCQRITHAFPLDHKPASASAGPAPAAVAPATAEKRRDVTVTSRGGGGATTLQTVIRTASVGEKQRRTSDDDEDAFSPARSTLSNGSSQTALVHLRQYYRRYYTGGGVADSNYSRT